MYNLTGFRLLPLRSTSLRMSFLHGPKSIKKIEVFTVPPRT